MKFIFYIPPDNEVGELVSGLVPKLSSDYLVEVYTDFDELKKGVIQLDDFARIGCFVIGSMTELERFQSIQVALDRIQTVLVLAFPDKDLIDGAHKLRPRYMVCSDYDLAEVEEVLRRLAERALNSK